MYIFLKGAEIEGVVRAALSHAIARTMNFEKLFGLSYNDAPGSSAVKETPKEKIPLKVTSKDFDLAIDEINPMFGVAEDQLSQYLLDGILSYGKRFDEFYEIILNLVKISTSNLENSSSSSSSSSKSFPADNSTSIPAPHSNSSLSLSSTWRFAVVLQGSPGCGKTAIAASVAKKSGYPFVRLITPDWLNSKASDQIGVCRVINQVFFNFT
jgi:vesicle-fusing ATPase